MELWILFGSFVFLLLIGTTLVALVLTGGRTAQAETDRLLDTEFPVDLVVSVAPDQEDARPNRLRPPSPRRLRSRPPSRRLRTAPPTRCWPANTARAPSRI